MSEKKNHVFNNSEMSPQSFRKMINYITKGIGNVSNLSSVEYLTHLKIYLNDINDVIDNLSFDPQTEDDWKEISRDWNELYPKLRNQLHQYILRVSGNVSRSKYTTISSWSKAPLPKTYSKEFALLLVKLGIYQSIKDAHIPLSDESLTKLNEMSKKTRNNYYTSSAWETAPLPRNDVEN